MEYRTLEINLVSAKGLKQVNLISKMDVYVVVSISGGHTKANQKTPVDNNGNTNPTWNFPMKFTVDAHAADQNRLTLVFKLRCERTLGDKDVGEVHVPVKELLDGAGEGKTSQFVSYQVRKPSGKPKGELNFSYKFSETGVGAVAPVSVKGDEPVTAYPVSTPMAGSSSMYPPPHAYAAASSGPYPPPGGGYPPAPGGYPPHGVGGYGYPPPPPQYGGYPQQPPPPGYGYPPQQGYGYPQVQQPPKKNKSKMGLGLGAGLLGGALGGLLIGDMISDGGGGCGGGGCGGGGCGGGF